MLRVRAFEEGPAVWVRLGLENMDEAVVIEEDCAAALCERCCKNRCEEEDDDNGLAAGRKDPPFDWLAAFRSMGMPNSDSMLLAT